MQQTMFLTQTIKNAGTCNTECDPPGGSEWIISVGYVDKSFTALGSSGPREVRLEL